MVMKNFNEEKCLENLEALGKEEQIAHIVSESELKNGKINGKNVLIGIPEEINPFKHFTTRPVGYGAAVLENGYSPYNDLVSQLYKEAKRFNEEQLKERIAFKDNIPFLHQLSIQRSRLISKIASDMACDEIIAMYSFSINTHLLPYVLLAREITKNEFLYQELFDACYLNSIHYTIERLASWASDSFTPDQMSNLSDMVFNTQWTILNNIIKDLSIAMHYCAAIIYSSSSNHNNTNIYNEIDIELNAVYMMMKVTIEHSILAVPLRVFSMWSQLCDTKYFQDIMKLQDPTKNR